MEELLTSQNILLVAAIYAIVQALKMALPKWSAGKVGQRVIPLLPLALGVAGALLGMGGLGEATIADQVTIGIIAGSVAAQGFKVGRTTLLGRGVDPVEEE